jgi:hypothetical protein
MFHFCNLQTVLGQNMEISNDAHHQSSVAPCHAVHAGSNDGANNGWLRRWRWWIRLTAPSRQPAADVTTAAANA